MKKLFCILVLLQAHVFIASAQFTAQGTIEYERKVNVHRQMEDMDDEGGWFEKIKSQIPKFTTAYFNLYFNTEKSLYKPGKETENPFKMFGGAPAAENVVYTDFNTSKVVASKEIYEQKFLIEDSMRQMEWRITDEIRTVANYKCRKAVGKICDSVYVVAFYTEDIMVSGGPEMFSGLPGMILEIAIPRLYSTWTATKVDVAQPAATIFTPPAKGKKSTQGSMYESLKSGLKDWGKFAARNIWWSLL